MINTADIIRQMTANAQAIRALLQTVTTTQMDWKTNPDTWSLYEVMGHLYNEERVDFRQHLIELLSDPPKEWGELNIAWQVIENFYETLDKFLIEREASIAWLEGLDSPDWEGEFEVPFGPQPEIITLSAGDILVSWVAHDYLHIRQINELLFAWNEKQARPFKVDYAGGW